MTPQLNTPDNAGHLRFVVFWVNPLGLVIAGWGTNPDGDPDWSNDQHDWHWLPRHDAEAVVLAFQQVQADDPARFPGHARLSDPIPVPTYRQYRPTVN